jgi:hypothetical protein
MWFGIGNFDSSKWPDGSAQARTTHETSNVISTPLLIDYLEEGFAALGYSLEK